MIWQLAATTILKEDAPDQDQSDPPAREPSLPASPSESPMSLPAAAPAAAPPPSVSPSQSAWDMRQMMWLACGSWLPAVLARSDAAMPAEGLPAASERAPRGGREQARWAQEEGGTYYSICCRRFRITNQ